jgi:arsenate reductase (thioredoxin)
MDERGCANHLTSSELTMIDRRWLVLLILFVSGELHAQSPSDEHVQPSVLFVCEHGSVKSLLAKLLFERAAAREGLSVTAASRGTIPDRDVPEWMREALNRDGFVIGDWRPAALQPADLSSAQRVITFDVSLPESEAADSPPERWDGLPSVSENYPQGRNAIERKVEQLVRELKISVRTPSSK